MESQKTTFTLNGQILIMITVNTMIIFIAETSSVPFSNLHFAEPSELLLAFRHSDKVVAMDTRMNQKLQLPNMDNSLKWTCCMSGQYIYQLSSAMQMNVYDRRNLHVDISSNPLGLKSKGNPNLQLMVSGSVIQ
jgi:hypothetical protein